MRREQIQFCRSTTVHCRHIYRPNTPHGLIAGQLYVCPDSAAARVHLVRGNGQIFARSKCQKTNKIKYIPSCGLPLPIGHDHRRGQSTRRFLWPNLNHIQLGRRLRLKKEEREGDGELCPNKSPFCPRIKKMIGAARFDEKEFGSDQQVQSLDRAQHASSAHLFLNGVVVGVGD